MKVFYVLIENYGIFIFEAANIACAFDHADDNFPQLDLKKSDINELSLLTSIPLESNRIGIGKQ